MQVRKNIVSIIFVFVICMLGGCAYGKESATSLLLINEILAVDS